MVKAAIIGGSGYTGGELARLLCRHPKITLEAMTSRRLAGVKVADEHSYLEGFVDLKYEAAIDAKEKYDIVFVAAPHGASMEVVPSLLERGMKVVDLSGDYRLSDPNVYSKWYGLEHKDVKNLDIAAYGIPELFREDIAKATLVANPGCYPTCTCLGLAPLFSNGVVEERVIVDAKSGTSGAGMEPTKMTHHPTCGSQIIPYKVGTHRHSPEIQDGVGEGRGIVDRSDLHASPDADRAGHALHQLCPAQEGHGQGFAIQALFRFLLGREVRTAGQLAVDLVRGRVQLLRDRSRTGRSEHRRGDEHFGQSGQGRERTGDSERQHHARPARDSGIGLPGIGGVRMKAIEGGITSPLGWKATGVRSGIKKDRLDLAVLYSETPARTALAYTQNKARAAPIEIMMRDDPQTLRAFVINSGNANALTGEKGMEDAETMRVLTAQAAQHQVS